MRNKQFMRMANFCTKIDNKQKKYTSNCEWWTVDTVPHIVLH